MALKKAGLAKKIAAPLAVGASEHRDADDGNADDEDDGNHNSSSSAIAARGNASSSPSANVFEYVEPDADGMFWVQDEKGGANTIKRFLDQPNVLERVQDRESGRLGERPEPARHHREQFGGRGASRLRTVLQCHGGTI